MIKEKFLLTNAKIIKGQEYIKPNRKIVHITDNSKDVKPSSLFFCLSSHPEKASKYIDEALERGAILCVSQIPLKKSNLVVVKCIQDLFIKTLKAFLDIKKPPRLIGITGTNGKTTVSYLLYQLLNFKHKAGLTGTIVYEAPGIRIPATLTTPNAFVFYNFLKELEEKKIEFCISEVSSHASTQERIKLEDFEVGVLTNITRDHLDYHGNFENYKEAKIKFLEKVKDVVVVNEDIPYASEIISRTNNKRIITYSLKNKSNFSIKPKKFTLDYTEFELITPQKKYSLKSTLIGILNLYNLCAALATYSIYFPIEEVKEYVSSLTPPPGRLQIVSRKDNITIIVDYAHTPDALKNILGVLKSLPHRRLHLVFGCGGNRDRGKRPIMGEIAENLADKIYLTNDNPRFEEPHQIIKDIEKGMKFNKHKIIPDRREAIKEAINNASPGDIVLIAGKGHENYQSIKGKNIPFSDVHVIKEILEC